MPILSNHETFRATSVAALEAAVTSRLGARPLQLPTGGPLDARAEYCALPAGQLWGCGYGRAVTLAFPEGDYIRVQLPEVGAGRVHLGSRGLALDPGTACVTDAAAAIEFGEGYRQLVWRVPASLLARKLAALTGRAVAGGIAFQPAIDLTTAEGRSLQGALLCLARTANELRGPIARTVLAELEEAVVAALLCTAGHNQRRLLEGSAARLAPRQVRRAESYIEAHWHEPLAMEAIVAAAGASARSVFRAFAEHRGYSPMQFLKRVRLEQAHRMLREPGPATSVTDVALRCGYGQLSRFAHDFQQAFGERPSTLLKRMREDQGPSHGMH